MKKYRFVFSTTLSLPVGTVTIKSVGVLNWLVPSSYTISKVLENYNKEHPHDNPIVQSYCKYLEVVK